MRVSCTEHPRRRAHTRRLEFSRYLVGLYFEDREEYDATLHVRGASYWPAMCLLPLSDM